MLAATTRVDDGVGLQSRSPYQMCGGLHPLWASASPPKSGKMSDVTATVIVVPGFEDSDPDHWQSRWCTTYSDYRRVTGLDWYKPARTDWVDALDRAIRSVDGPVVVAAHSLGSVTVAFLGADAPPNLVGALLVTPCDTEQEDFPDVIRGFAPMPSDRLPFPSALVASRDDPWMRFERAVTLADAWGSRLIDAGTVGHLNVASGFGPWPAGELLLDQLRG